ncbi:transposase [Myxococcota bacterium]|nr:transposase [Myxococcota bacterium]
MGPPLLFSSLFFSLLGTAVFRQLPEKSPDNNDMSPKYQPCPEQHWPHSPAHWFYHPGIYMVTASTLGKTRFFDTPEKRDLLQELIFSCALEYQWDLEAWAVMSNHYHLVLRSPEDATKFCFLINKVHTLSSKRLNLLDGTPGRRVWFQYWDSRITFESSFLARLAYVHGNAVHHGLVERPEDYPWCSAAWFLANAPRELSERVAGFHMDRVLFYDDF